MSNLPASLQNLAAGLQQSVANQGADTDGYLKFTKQGIWIYGAEDIETQEGATFAVNLNQLQHGWVAWGDEKTAVSGVKCGEVMTSVREPLFPVHKLDMIENATWSQQIAMQVLCMNGEDEGLQFIINFNSEGGRKAYAKLSSEIIKHLHSGEDTIMPIVELHSDSYKHAQYGTTFFPVFTIVEWVEPEGDIDDYEPSEAELEDEQLALEQHEEIEDAVLVEEEPEPVKPKRAALKSVKTKPAARGKATSGTAAAAPAKTPTRRKPAR